MIKSVLKGFPNVIVYQDDILVTGPGDASHLENFETVLKRLTEAGLRVKKQKCVFLAELVVHLGHKIDPEGLHPLPEKLRAIKKVSQSTNVS